MQSAPPTGSDVVIRHGRLYWPSRAGEVVPEPAAEGPTPIERFRNTTLLVIVLLYLLFNWGFQQVRFPPVAGGGLPIGEIVLFLSLATINHARLLGRLGHAVYLLPFLLWWAFGLGRAVVDFSMYGLWALRDAAHVIESLFLIAGFAFASHASTVEKFFDWLPKFLIIAVVYGLLYPFRYDIWSFSPTIMAGNGFEVPIFGSMANTALLMIMAAIYLMLFHGNKVLANLIAILLIGYTIAIFQARTLYLVVIAVFGFLILYRRSTFGNIALVAYVSGLLLGVIGLLGLQVEGRLGAAFSFDFLVEHFLAIFGISSGQYEGIASAAQGVDQRLDWWTNVFERLLANPFHLLLGLGYGLPLTDFFGPGGVPIRELHNSYITVVARTGIIGGVCWILMMVSMVRCWHRTFLDAADLGWREGENRLMIMMVFFISIWVLALGEDGFEKPYNIIPFYFLFGIVLRMSLLLEDGEIGPEPEEDERPAHPYLDRPLSLRYR